MMDWPVIVSGVLVISGALLTIVGAYGTLRLPDVYTRLHAASITDTLATFLILAGLAVPSLVAGEWLIAVKLLFVLIFLWFTSPIASYSIGHAAFFAAQKPMLDHDLTDGEGGTA